MVTYYNYLQLFNNVLLAHPNVASFRVDEVEPIDVHKSGVYPLAHIVTETMGLVEGRMTYTFTLLVLDRVGDVVKEGSGKNNRLFNDWRGVSNIVDVINSAQGVVTDVFGYLKRNPQVAQFEIEDEVIITPVVEQGPNILAGVSAQFTITAQFQSNACLFDISDREAMGATDDCCPSIPPSPSVTPTPSVTITPTPSITQTPSLTPTPTPSMIVLSNFIVGGETCWEPTDFTPQPTNVTTVGNTTTFDLLSGTVINNESFRNCSTLIEASFPSITNINQLAFANSSLVSASFPNATTIGQNAFNSCLSLVSASFPNVTSIGNGAFTTCISLVSASFPNATTIGQQSFTSCISLVSASFPNVTSIGLSGFQNCNALRHIYLPSLSGVNALGGSPLANNTFIFVPNTGYITVPSFYSSSNSGAPDGDLIYLTTAPRNWTINYI